MTTMAVLASAALVAAGCGDDDSDSTSTSASSTKTTAAQSDSMDTMDASAGASLISSPGVDLRYTLDRLLGEHAALALVGLNKTIAGEQDAKAVVDALGDNTDDLSAAIGSVYGDDAAESFKDQWTAHIGFFADYATGVATKDNAKKAAARKQLDGYQKSFSTFLSEAAGLDADAGAAALGMHVKQLTAAMDQFGAGKYEQSYESSREAYAHMFGTADALAAAISKQKPDDFGMGDVTQKAADTRALLGQQLGEHAFLATVALNKTMTGAKDAEQAVASLDTNTVDLGKTIGSVYGDEAEAAFLKQWRAHIGFFVDYATATVGGDEAKADQAKTDLDGYASGFDEFLSGATGADKGTFEPGLQEHVTQLIGAIDATQDGDVDEAWGLERDAYAHMYMAADAITAAIVEQNPDKFGS
jgi:hypothetical protein